MTVFLHIGFHKTGSTAIRNSVASVASRLEEAGVIVPASLSRWSGHADMAWSFAQSNHPWQDASYSREDVIAHYQPVLEDACRRGMNVLLTSEEFCRLDFDPQALDALAEFLRPYSPRVLGFVRDPLRFLLSRWRHEVTMGGECRTLSSFLGDAENLASADFMSRAECWKAAFSADRCTFVSYEAACHPPGTLLQCFFDFIGASPLVELAQANAEQERKLHPLLVDVARLVNAESDSESLDQGILFERLFELGEILPPATMESLLEWQSIPGMALVTLARMAGSRPASDSSWHAPTPP